MISLWSGGQCCPGNVDGAGFVPVDPPPHQHGRIFRGDNDVPLHKHINYDDHDNDR